MIEWATRGIDPVMDADPLEKIRLRRDGLIARTPLVCEVCGQPIAPGESALCGDGYLRIYGEFVLSELSDLYEDNWPVSHERCAR
jgi:hypothetical protein